MNKKHVLIYFTLYLLLIILNIKNFSLLNFGLVTTAFLIFALITMFCDKKIVNICRWIFIIILFYPFIPFASYIALLLGKKNDFSIVNLVLAVANLLTYIYLISLLFSSKRNNKLNYMIMCFYLIVSIVLIVVDVVTNGFEIFSILKLIINMFMHLLIIKCLYDYKKV